MSKLVFRSYDVYIKLKNGKEFIFISILYKFHKQQYCFTDIDSVSYAFP